MRWAICASRSNGLEVLAWLAPSVRSVRVAMSPRRIVMNEVLCHVSKLEDRRSTVNRKHPLASVIGIAILGVVAGASGPMEIATRADIHVDALKKLVLLSNGGPRKDVFRGLF